MVPLRIFIRNPVRSLIWWSSRAFVKRHVLVLWATSRVLAMQIVFACIGCSMRCMLLVVPPRLQPVREDHFQNVLSEQPPDGPIVITEPLEHVRYHSGACWPTSVREVDSWRRLVHGCWGQCINAAFCRPRLNRRTHVLCFGHAALLAVPCLMCHLCAGRLARARCPTALHAVDGLQALAWSLQGFS